MTINDKKWKKLWDWIEKNKIKAVDEVPLDTIMVTALAEGYPVGEDNKFWKLEANQSSPRDVVCHFCKKQVVMSNWAYEQYIKHGRRHKVADLDCINKSYQ